MAKKFRHKHAHAKPPPSHHTHPAAVSPAPAGDSTKILALAAVAAALLFGFVLLKNAWFCDDVWIPLRQVEQLFAGNGLRWNPHERIQLFTSSVGFFMLAFGRLLSTDYFLNYAVQALAFNALVLVLLARLFADYRKWIVAVLLLLASNAYMDYTWSGLHNFVGYALLAGFLLVWKRLWNDGDGDDADTAARQRASKIKAVLALAALAGLAPLFRHDFAILIWPPTLFMLWTLRKTLSARVMVGAAALALTPIALWTLFSLVYFGFPLPVTAYTKLGGGFSRWTSLSNGGFYFLYTLKADAITLLVIFAALVWQGLRGTSAGRALAAAGALYLLYILFTGADYMGGRFLSYVYLLAVVLLVSDGERWITAVAAAASKKGKGGHSRRRKSFHATAPKHRKYGAPVLAGVAPVLAGLAGLAAVWMLALPHTPLKSPFSYGEEARWKQYAGGIADERASSHYASNIPTYLAFKRGEITDFPDSVQADFGKILARATAPVLHLCNMGLSPFNARLDQKFIDVYGLSDVLQSRMPALNTRPGHLIRRLPKGYLESVAADDALIADPQLNEWYKKLRLVTQSEELFSAQRFAAILAVNTSAPPLHSIRKGPPISPEPLLCRAIYNPSLQKQLEEQIATIDAATLNRSDLAF